MTTCTLDDQVARIAERHHGVFALHHLESLGVSQQSRHLRVATGRWVAVHEGVFRVAGAPPSWRGAIVAATWAGGQRAVASHRSAAALWGLPGGQTNIVELTCPRWRRARHDGLVVHESTRLGDEDVTEVDGVRCTTVDRTLFDLCSCAGALTIDLAIDAALRRQLTTMDALVLTHERLATQGRRGGRQFRSVLAARTSGPTPESAPERLVARTLVLAGLPAPAAQHVIVGADGSFVARVDLAYPQHRIAIEYDSYQEHTGKVALVRDSARRNALVAAGWTVFSATAADLQRNCRTLIRDVRRVLSREVASHT